MLFAQVTAIICLLARYSLLVLDLRYFYLRAIEAVVCILLVDYVFGSNLDDPLRRLSLKPPTINSAGMARLTILR